jgi:transcriptional regulator with XRE-family HTH domain
MTGRLMSLPREMQPEAIVSGYVFKAIRESLGMTQEALAQRLRVDTNTIQAWETNRRPLTATQVARLMGLRLRLSSLGATNTMLDALDSSIRADQILTYVLSTPLRSIEPLDHPFAVWLLPRSVAEMLSWPITGLRPTALGDVLPARRRGPVASRPVLSAVQRTLFFEHFINAAEASLTVSDPEDVGAVLLRQQAYYQLGWNADASMPDWFQRAQRVDDAAHYVHGWSPRWLAARSLAVALTRRGQLQPLTDFIETAFVNDTCENADLHYWAYWAGDIQLPIHHKSLDSLIRHRQPWLANRLLRRMADNLGASNTCLDLYIRSLSILVTRPAATLVLGHDRALKASLQDRVTQLLDGPPIVSRPARLHLDRIHSSLTVE